ncbi:hypothetical protein [Phenylobacterium sp.]|jgi:hypothetical protein|uniref:hypothetical protein n=1 Tax=Phenylobacterium sp. TaxID=1871053 RepID=UPI002F3EEE5D
MRLLVLAFVTVLAAASAALAAPTCNDVSGRTVRCGTPGAMPVGWTPPPEVLAARPATEPGPSARQLFALVCFLGGLVTLFALLPDFEDGRGGGWDRQEGDDP